MRFLKAAINSRLIYPSQESLSKEGDDLLGRNVEDDGALRRVAATVHRNVQLLLKTRVRVRSNISAPLIAVVLFPLVCLLITTGLFLQISGRSPIGNTLPPLRKMNTTIDDVFVEGCQAPDNKGPRAKAALVVLARNKEIEGVTESMLSLERHFNRWFEYPYVFLNDEPFNSTFKQVVQNYTNAKVEFGTISPEDWNFPAWADEGEIEEAIAKQGDDAIKYGAMQSYHKMCRFYSGKFYNHPLLHKYDWYWRVEPEVQFFCDITYDPFIEMEKRGKVYGFTLIIKELTETIPNLFRQTMGFKVRNNMNTTRTWEMFLSHATDEEFKEEYAKKMERQQKKNEKNKKQQPFSEWDDWEDDNKVHPEAMNGQVYNNCHFWSNFEIARLDFFRSKEYNDYFKYLERSGGFWTERWGDAPVHSLAAGLFLEPEQIHYFRDIGYRHTTIQHCPGNTPGKQLPHEPYLPNLPNVGKKKIQANDEYWQKFDEPRKNGVGCRCRCGDDTSEFEAKPSGCLSKWAKIAGGWVDDEL